MANEIIRTALMKAHLKQWELAEILGLSESVLCRRLRHELSDDDREYIITKIEHNRKQE